MLTGLDTTEFIIIGVGLGLLFKDGSTILGTAETKLLPFSKIQARLPTLNNSYEKIIY